MILALSRQYLPARNDAALERDMDELISIGEAARRLGGLSVHTISAWLSRGRLPRTKVGARTMIRESDLRAFISACNPDVVPETTMPADGRQRAARKERSE
jgi:excisionase family DNA binding protein